MTRPRATSRDRTTRGVTYGFLILFLVYSMFPLGWMLATSFKPEEQTKEYPPRLIPKTFTLENYGRVLTQTRMPRFVMNSLILSWGTVIAVLGLASLAGYGFSRYRFPGYRLALTSFLIAQMFPAAILIVPIYNILLHLGLLNQKLGLVLAYCTVAVPFCVWMLKGYFDTIPYELVSRVGARVPRVAV